MVVQLSPSYEGTPFQPTYEHLKQENEQLKQELVQERQAHKKDVEHLKQLQSFINWENKLFAKSSEEMSDAHKVLARKLPDYIKKVKDKVTTDTARDDGLVRGYMADLAAMTGKSKDRVGATLKDMHTRGLVKRDLKRVFTKEDGYDNAVYLDVTPELISLNLPQVEPRNTGNKQKHFVLCKSCGTELVNVKQVIQGTCPNCGEVHIYDPQKKEDKAFIVTAETAEHFEEWYGEVDPGEIEEMLADTTPRVESPIEPTLLKRQLAISESETTTEPIPLEPIQETIKTPVQLPINHSGKVKKPRCRKMECFGHAENVDVRLWPNEPPSFYCNSHNGYIDDKGNP